MGPPSIFLSGYCKLMIEKIFFLLIAIALLAVFFPLEQVLVIVGGVSLLVMLVLPAYPIYTFGRRAEEHLNRGQAPFEKQELKTTIIQVILIGAASGALMIVILFIMTFETSSTNKASLIEMVFPFLICILASSFYWMPYFIFRVWGYQQLAKRLHENQ